MIRTDYLPLLLAAALATTASTAHCEGLQRLRYGATNGGEGVDLGVGLWAWPLPMDYDSDGDFDLLVSCPDVPFNGTYLFENPDGDAKFPRFKRPVRLGPGYHDIQPSDVDGETRLLLPGKELIDFRTTGLEEPSQIYPQENIHPVKVRGNQWRYVDYDGDGVRDLIVGVGDWSGYGWDNAYNSRGEWTNGPLRGYVYVIANRGTNERPDYAKPEQLRAGDNVIDVYGAPTPNFGDFDGDGDLDLLCGEFMDGFNYFENTGTRTDPKYAVARRLTHGAEPLAMDLQMIIPIAIDWDRDGDLDLVVGDEDGRVALVEHTGKVVDGLPQFVPPVYFQQEPELVKFGALATPVSYDWDGDGDEDLLCGNTAGYIGFIENLDGGNPPRWAPPVRLKVGDETFRVQAGPNGSIQGPCEAKWGYTTFSVADWDGDGLPDIVLNSILGRVAWLKNIGTRTEPKLAPPEPVDVAWELGEGETPPKPAWTWWTPGGNELAPEWRTTPVAVDWTGDGLCDLVMLDHEGYLALYERYRDGDRLRLKPGRRAFRIEGDGAFDGNHKEVGNDDAGLRLNAGSAGKSGRRKLCIVDWNRDGKLDLIVNSANANILLNLGERDGVTTFRDLGPVDELKLAGHDTSPTTVDWNNDGVRELLLGAEDGHFYYLKRNAEKH